MSFICAEVLVLMNFGLVGASDDKTFGTQLYEDTAAVLKAFRKTSWLEYLLVTLVESM